MLQFGLLVKNHGCGDMNGDYTHHDLTSALDQAYEIYKLDGSQLAIFMLDTETGEIIPHLNKRALDAMMHHFEKMEARDELDNERFGSYERQHFQRLSEVVS